MSNTPMTLPSERAATELQQSQATVHSFLRSLVPEMQRALPKGLDADRMARLALTVVRKTPKLAVCTRESFAGALLSAAALGLEPGVEGEAWLVPYEDHKKRITECQLIIGYQGYSKLFWQHPLARGLDAQAVFEGDDFDYALGTDPFLRHRPNPAGEQGEVVAYYAVAQLANRASRFVVLTPDRVRQLRQGRVGTRGDIDDPEHWMERKTALRQLFKLVPKSARLAEALVIDEWPGSELRARLQQGPPAEALPPASAGSPRSDGEAAPDGPSPSEPLDGEAGTVQDTRRNPPPGPAPDPGEAARRPETATAPPAPPARPASKAKARLVQARLDALGVEDNPDERGYVLGTLLHRPIDPTAPLEKQLTGAEADTLRDTLNDCDTKADLWEQLDRIEQGGENRSSEEEP